jgi:hypothetical protein
MQSSLYILFAACLSVSVFSGVVKAEPPPGIPPLKTAADVQCDGCIDTTDIADEAVTEQKLSADLQNKLQSTPGMPVVVDGNGALIGNLIGVDSVLRTSLFGLAKLGYYILTDQGYAAQVSTDRGTLAFTHTFPLYFLTEDCTGDAYAGIDEMPPGWVRYLLNEPLNGEDTFYVPINATPISGNFSSAWYGDVCDPSPLPVTQDAYQVFPNDPIVTGVRPQNSKERYPIPLRIVRP